MLYISSVFPFRHKQTLVTLPIFEIGEKLKDLEKPQKIGFEINFN